MPQRANKWQFQIIKRFHHLRTPSQSVPTGFLPPLVPERNIVGDKSDSRRWQSPAFAEAVACPALHRVNGGRVDVPPAGLLPGTAGHYTRQKCIKIYWNLAAKGRITHTHSRVLHRSSKSPAVLGTDGSLLSRSTAGSQSDSCGNPAGLRVKRTSGPAACRNVFAGCSNRPTYRTTFYIMTFPDAIWRAGYRNGRH